MQEKLLPEFLEKLIRPLKKNQSQNAASEKNQKPSKESSVKSDFNLIPVSQYDVLESAKISRRTSNLRAFVIFISFVFGVLLIINFVLTLVIDAQKSKQEDLLVSVNSFYGVEERVKEIGRKTIVYKKILSEKKDISTRYKFLIDNFGNHVDYRSITLNPSGFLMSINVDTPLDFTNLITRYLGGGVVSEIVIESASLQSENNTYDVYMRGVFK